MHDNNYFTILAIGHSNMVHPGGRDTRNKLVSSVYPRKVEWYDYREKTFSRDPTMKFQGGRPSSASPSKFCADKLLPVVNKPIIILPMALSVSSGLCWKKGDTLYSNTVTAGNEVCHERQCDINLVIWFSGEMDKNDPEDLADLFKHFKTDIDGWTEDTVVGFTENSSKVFPLRMNDLLKRSTGHYVIQCEDYPTKTDQVHFTLDSYIRIGEDFARGYQTTLENRHKPVVDVLQTRSCVSVREPLDGYSFNKYSLVYRPNGPEGIGKVQFVVNGTPAQQTEVKLPYPITGNLNTFEQNIQQVFADAYGKNGIIDKVIVNLKDTLDQPTVVSMDTTNIDKIIFILKKTT